MKSFWHNLPRPFFVLAPMEAVTDVVFRHVVDKAAAPDVYFTEFTNATGWVHAGDKAIGGRLVKTDDEQSLVAQIWGSVPQDIAKLAAHCKELGFVGIDLNMGCPDSHAIKSGSGAALCRTPDLAGQLIEAARSSGLPVSVKCRLGYSRVDEWREWIGFLLRQDIVNLTVHLRTKKEMSKVPAHYELIPEIKAMRDEIAPQTLLTINGDIRDRQHGLELVEKYGIDGIMIGRGIFHDPFCFSAVEPLVTSSEETSAAQVSPAAYASETWREAVSEDDGGEQATVKKINILRYHLDLFDQYSSVTRRPFETLKRFFKIYIRDFDGAAELRDKLMHTKTTDEVRGILQQL